MGKGGQTPTPPTQQTSNMLEEQYAASQAMLNNMMMGMQNSMMGYGQALEMMQQTMAQSLISDTPEIYKPPEVDWNATKAELDNRMKAQYAVDSAKKYNFGTSIHTSPLLDDEAAETTTASLIAS